jgi:hypothetical protein
VKFDPEPDRRLGAPFDGARRIRLGRPYPRRRRRIGDPAGVPSG